MGLTEALSIGTSNECSWGVSYWCQSYDTAVRCGKVQHCNEKVWKVIKLACMYTHVCSCEIGCTFIKHTCNYYIHVHVHRYIHWYTNAEIISVVTQLYSITKEYCNMNYHHNITSSRLLLEATQSR